MTRLDLENVQFNLLAQGEDYRVKLNDIPAREFYVDETAGGVVIAPESKTEDGNRYAAIDVPEEDARELANHILEVLD